jgi:hypothetical protein
MNSFNLWVITRRKVVKTDVSGIYFCAIFKGRTFQETWALEMEPIGRSETFVLNHLITRINP